MEVIFTLSIFLFSISKYSEGIKHGQNLIWAQTPTLRLKVSRLVGIEGDPTEWVKTGEVKLHHIGAPHAGWQFKSLAYHYSKQTLFWSESMNKRIQGLVLNGSTDTSKIVTGISPDVEGLTVDWISNNIYWTDTLFNWIKLAPISSNVTCYKIIAQDGIDNPHGLAVYPQKGYLFWSDWGERPRIEMSDLLGQNRRIIVDTDILHPRGIVIDYQDNRLFWVDSKKDTIESIAFNGMNRKTVSPQDGTNLYGIALYDKYIFVTEQSKGHLKIFNKYTGDTYITYKLTYIPYGIIMYDEDSQPGDSSVCHDFRSDQIMYHFLYFRCVCDELGCDQICINDPLTGARCICGDGYSTNDDGITCTLEMTFSMPGHIYAISDAICQYPANLAYISLTNVTLENQCFLAERRGYLALAYDARDNNLYFSANSTKTISRIRLEVGANETTIIGGTGVVRGLSLDWLAGNIFWTDSTNKLIKCARKDGAHQKTIISEKLDEPLGIAAHPGNGIIYWTDIGETPKVESSYMDGSNRTIIMDTNLGLPNHMFIDFLKDRLYWTDSLLHHIRCLDIITGRITVYFTSPTSQFFGISIFKDFLLWTDSGDMNGLHVARLDKKTKERGIIHPGYGVATDLITYDVQNQPLFSDKGLPCLYGKHECEQLCLRGANLTYYCDCGLGYQLDDNGRTCSSTILRTNFLIVTDAYQKQIYQINSKSGSVNAIDMPIGHPIAVDYDPMPQRIYWSDNKARVLQGANIDGQMNEMLVGLSQKSVVDGLALDIIHRLLYYTDTGLDTINVVSLTNKQHRAVLIDEGLDEPRAIVVLPMEGTMFWTDWGFEAKIEMAQMDGSNKQTFLMLDKDSWPNGLTIDRKAKILYWADAKYNKIECINLDKTNKRTLLQQEEAAHFFGIFAMGSYLYFTDWRKTFVSRMSKDGGPVEQFGPPQFTKLYGIYGFNSSEIVQVPTGTNTSTTVTVSSSQTSSIQRSTTLTTTTATTTITTVTNNTSSVPTTKSLTTLPTTINRSTVPPSTLIPTTLPLNISIIPSSPSPFSSTPSSLPTTQSRVTESSLSTGSIAAIVTVVTIIITIIILFSVMAYKKYYIYRIPHDKLVEDKTDVFYRITFPDNNRDDATIDSGIENPTYDCYLERQQQQPL
ncbi:hypothetical protein LOTGIDRAFT_162349 [Lottia gigantea]|uniref:EGF-like domain-containing protein n=1 Tax=Lottia gigantea TaxID=225164 RepID=V4A840_LOTGI|nr:hypothetical protein LOTGIDRAFT_162349 [Lottia gigantea]ESO92872.1 hypothetical protein LOTGIDRAFT_162349 [Lottia gigantea]